MERGWIVKDRKLEAWLMEGVRQLVQELRPQKVILFGSHAYGEPTADSDLDLLIVLPTKEKSLAGRYRLVSPFFEPRRYPMDLIILSPQELEKRLNEWFDPFLREVVHRGVILYEQSARGRAYLGRKGRGRF